MSVVIINIAFHPQDLAGQCGQSRERVTFMIRRHRPGLHNACLQSTKHSSELPTPATILMLPHVAMCTLARWLHWIYKGKRGGRHLDLCILSFVRNSLKSTMVTWITKSQHDHLKVLFQNFWGPFRGSWQIISPCVLLFIYLLFAIRSPWVPSVGDVSKSFPAGPAPSKGRSSPRYI